MSGQAPRRSVLARMLILSVRLYQTWVSPLKLPSCRFEPTCSSYAVQAWEVHGALQGSGLAVWRLAKCAPWHPGGWDPVPERGQRWPRWRHVDGVVQGAGAADGEDAGPGEDVKTRSE